MLLTVTHGQGSMCIKNKALFMNKHHPNRHTVCRTEHTRQMSALMARPLAPLLWLPPSLASSHTQPEVLPGPSPASLSSLPSLVSAAVLEMTVLPPASSAAHCTLGK